MNWLPRARIFESLSEDPLRPERPGALGHMLVISWLGLVIEIGLHRHER